MKIKINLLNDNAIIPSKAHASDACYDVVATSVTLSEKYIEYGLGFSTEFDSNIVGNIYPRSSISNHDLIMCNAPGTIDSNYRGEWKVRFKLTPPNFLYFEKNNIEYSKYEPKIYNVGDKIAQISFHEIKNVEWEQVTTLETSDRGSGGFGSTGK